MKIGFLTSILLVCVNSNAQNIIYITPDYSQIKEISFSSVENSKRELSELELNNFEIIDTISTPYSLVIKSWSTIFIAIKNENKYDTYQLLTKEENNLGNIIAKDSLKQIAQKDTVLNKLDIWELSHPRDICMSHLYPGSAQQIRLDKFKNGELILKFSHNSYCCPTCSVPLNMQNLEGYVIFDFDKLQVLEIITRSSITHIIDGIAMKDWVVEFKKNYLKIGKRRYYYRNNKLICR